MKKLFLIFCVSLLLLNAQALHANDDCGPILEGQGITLSVKLSALHHSRGITREESRHLAEALANEVEKRFETLGEEQVFIGMIDGFASNASMLRGESSEGIGSEFMRVDIPEYIADVLSARGMPAEATWDKSKTPENPKTVIMITHFAGNDEGRRAAARGTVGGYNYKGSVFYYWARRVTPTAEKGLLRALWKKMFGRKAP